MANEITFGYIAGRDLEYAVVNPDGTEVTAQTALSEEYAGYYTNTTPNGDIAAGDMVIIHDVTEGGDFVCGQGQYKPEVSNTTVEDKVDIIDANVDTLIVAQQTVKTVDPVPEPVEVKSRLYI